MTISISYLIKIFESNNLKFIKKSENYLLICEI
jgi:hypothetical protein